MVLGDKGHLSWWVRLSNRQSDGLTASVSPQVCVSVCAHICEQATERAAVFGRRVFILLPLPSIDPCNGQFYKGKCLKYPSDVGNVQESGPCFHFFHLSHTHIVGYDYYMHIKISNTVAFRGFYWPIGCIPLWG